MLMTALLFSNDLSLLSAFAPLSKKEMAAATARPEAFHDCGAWETSLGATGGCDGSLILSTGNDEFAAAVAIVTCPGGPQIKTFVGRKDSTSPAKGSLLPDVFGAADDLYALFQRKGFTASELAALLGAPVNASQDSTPGKWDVQYYAETLSPPANIFVFPSDAKLAVHPTVGKEFKGFVGSQGKWTSAFGAAMTKMSLLGVGSNQKMIDCTNSVPRGTGKRDIRSSPINDRVR
ncbi:heme peroxidase [Leptodontidium sp. 2 PMI_412]|nr:heme peroxidase [Leptodontidium sp. 2 PMI_412]